MVKIKSNINKLLLSLAFAFSVVSSIILAVNISPDAPSVVMGLVFGLMLVSVTWAIISLLPESFKSWLFSPPEKVSMDSDFLAGEILQKSRESIRQEPKADHNDILSGSIQEKITRLKERQDHAHSAMDGTEKTGSEYPKQAEEADVSPSHPVIPEPRNETPDIEQIERFEQESRELEQKIHAIANPQKKEKPKPSNPIKNLERMAEKQSEIQCRNCHHFKRCVFIMKDGQREAIVNDQGMPSCALDKDNVVFMTENSVWMSDLDRSEGFICPGTCGKFKSKNVGESKDGRPKERTENNT